MLKEERQQTILEVLRREGKVLASELSQRLDVSEDTIRRDLRDLADAGKMQRVHGGGLPHSPAEASYAERLKMVPQAKAAVARLALRLLRPGQVILMDGGTTNEQVAHNLPADLHATVITNSLPVATALNEHPHVEVVVMGGKLFKESRITMGGMTLEEVRSLRADLYLLGVCSLHPEAGITVAELEESYLKRAMMACAAEVAALVTLEKLGTASPYLVAPAAQLTYLLTEPDAPADAIAAYRELGIQIIQ